MLNGERLVRRVLGPAATLEDRGADKAPRYLVAPDGWGVAGGALPGWHFGQGDTWDAALASYHDAVVEHGLSRVAAVFSRYTFTTHNEHRMYPLLEQLLRAEGLDFVREHRLDERNRPDFWFPELRVALEVKVRGRPHDVEAQIERYAEHVSVAGVLLASSLAKLTRVPDSLAFKPVRAVRLAGAFG
jgi:hypothetical protein